MTEAVVAGEAHAACCRCWPTRSLEHLLLKLEYTGNVRQAYITLSRDAVGVLIGHLQRFLDDPLSFQAEG